MGDCPHHEAIIVRVETLEERMDRTGEIQESILCELRGIKGFMAQGRTALFVLIGLLVAQKMGFADTVKTFILPFLK